MEQDPPEVPVKPFAVVLDDDPSISLIVQDFTGLEVMGIARSSEFLARLPSLKPAAILIDVHLSPNESGLDYVPIARKMHPFVPILVITSDEREDVIASALGLGANDFVQKPIKRRELAARLMLRVEDLALRNRADALNVGDLTFDRRLRIVAGGKIKRHLSPKEAMMFESVVLSQGMVIERQSLKRRVWGDVKVTDGAFDKMLHQVRAILGDVSEVVSLVSIYGTGVAVRIRMKDETHG
jgi:DNA-binding response OmpR family regulator